MRLSEKLRFLSESLEDPVMSSTLSRYARECMLLEPPARPRGILIHRTEAGHTGKEVAEHEALYGYGYHFFIRRDADGTVDELYPIGANPVWHARAWSHSCVGIAVHGDFVPSKKSKFNHPTAQQLASLKKLCLELWEKYGPLPIYGHTDLPKASWHSKVCPGSNLDVAKLAREVFEAYCKS